MTTIKAGINSAGSPAGASGSAEATPAQVQRWLDMGEAVLIDVREPDEHRRERIEGSVLMPLSAFDAREAAALAKPGQRLVFHCRSGARSEDARRATASSGVVSNGSAASMAGGIEAWKRERRPVVVNRSAARLSIIRQVQLIVGTMVLVGSVLAYFVHPGFVGIAAFFGAGLVFAGSTGFCGLAKLLGVMPWNRVGVSSARESGGSCNAG